MLGNLLSNRWIQGGIAFFAVCVAGSLLYSWHVQRTTDRFLERLIKSETATGSVEGMDIPPQGELMREVPGATKDPSSEVPVHSNATGTISGEKTFSQLLATMAEMDPEDYLPRFKAITEAEFYALSVEEQELMKKVVRAALWQEEVDYYAERGLKPPPPGYNYARVNGGPWQLFKKNEPYVFVSEDGAEGYGANWQLSDTEWDRYVALGAITDKSTAKALRISPEVVELAAVWQQALYEKTWGKLPGGSIHVTYDRPITPEDEERERALAIAKLAAIRPPERAMRVNYDVVYQLIEELEEELNR